MPTILAYITPHKIEPEKILLNINSPESGAIVSFLGIVRNHNNNKKVSYLEYEAHETLAQKIMEEILQEAHNKWQINRSVAIHRTGKLLISEIAVAIYTCSAHRKEAYLANEYIINRIKHEAPIWKKETYTDGSYEWGNNCNCEHAH